MWFENRYLIIQNEFTVQQTQGPATAAYAYLSANIHPADVAIKEVNINYDTLDIFTGNSIRLIGSVAPYDAAKKTLKWTSQNDEIVRVDNGIVDVVGEGEIYVYLESEDGNHRDSCLIRAKEYVSVTGIEILNEDIELIEGDSDSLEVAVYPENATNQNFSIEVEDPNIASISETGLVKALKPGTTVIKATTMENAYSDNIELTVLQDNTSIEEKGFAPRIWPNPNKGQFFVNTNDIPASAIGIKLSDAEGKTIFDRNFDISNRDLITINMGQQTPGVYFISIYTDNNLYSPASRIVID
jgi:uncharacterized protein YjdB